MNWTLKSLIIAVAAVQSLSDTLSFKDLEATFSGKSVCIEKVLAVRS